MSNYRNRKLLDLARGMPCQLRISGICCGDAETTVAAHANSQKWGKGMSIKAHDWASCHACYACHAWLDRGKASKADKEEAFLNAALATYGALFEAGKLEVRP